MSDTDPSAITLSEAGDSIAALVSKSRDDTRQYQVSALSWAVASLLAINAGGVATAIGASDRLSYPLVPASLFFGGVCLSLCTAYFFFGGISTLHDDMDGLVDDIKAETAFDEEKRSELITRLDDIHYSLYPSVFTASLSGLALLLGAISFVFVMKPFDHANANRCLAVQRDMLSARPARPDGPDLFQALGCRPQGEGSVYAPPRHVR